MQASITQLEEKADALSKKIDALPHSTPLAEKQMLYQTLSSLHEEIEALFFRWEELEEKNRSSP